MSPAELTCLSAPAGQSARVRASGERLLCGWGRTAPTRARMLRPRGAEEVAYALAESSGDRGGAIARGAGRSYGDAAQNGGGAVIDATALRGPIALDVECGLVRVGAGRTFAQLLLYLAARELTLPVVPGTRHLTVGGAIAADVHGKNHLRDGSFARHVDSLTLCTPADGPLLVSAERDPELFAATLGGMGLTGVVVEATLRLAPLRNPCAVADVDRLESLEQALALIGGEQRHRYAIAWVDLLAEGAAFGRAVLTRSDEVPPISGEARAGGGPGGPGWSNSASGFDRLSGRGSRAGAGGSRNLAAGTAPAWESAGTAPTCPGVGKPPFSMYPRLSVPRGLPGGLLRPATVRAFNAVHWHTAPRAQRGRRLSMSAQLFPLDALGEWNRLYGSAGLLQYQFVVGHGQEEALLRVVHRLRERRQPMYLAVLKRFGQGSGGPLSFPIEGLTLAIDLPAGAPGLYRALDEVDELVAEAGGRVYLAKDARLRPQTLAAMYPDLERFRELRARVDPDGVLRSDMGRRLGLCG
jgi:decaprenylphospho-beta-D-ribofuranose 2-oxidase